MVFECARRRSRIWIHLSGSSECAALLGVVVSGAEIGFPAIGAPNNPGAFRSVCSRVGRCGLRVILTATCTSLP